MAKAWLAAMVAATACARAPDVRVPVTVVVRGDANAVATAKAALAQGSKDVDVRVVELSAPLEETSVSVAAVLDRARAAYDEPSWQKCIAAVGDPALVTKLLAAGERDGASRVLFWRAACLLSKGDEAAARAVATELAALDLPIPSERSDPLVPRMLNDAALEASRTPAQTIHVTSAGPELSVSFDGRKNVCVTPCPLSARRGRHLVRVEADGRTPEDRDVLVEGSSVEARFDPPGASPDLAARQWVSRWASSPSIDAPTSLHLLADATRARNLALLVLGGGTHPGMQGALVVDGAVRTRAEREHAHAVAAPSLLHDLLVSGRVIESKPLLARPLFWIAVVATAAGAAVLTYYLATLPHTVTVSP